jgi:hypothetical protein
LQLVRIISACYGRGSIAILLSHRGLTMQTTTNLAIACKFAHHHDATHYPVLCPKCRAHCTPNGDTFACSRCDLANGTTFARCNARTVAPRKPYDAQPGASVRVYKVGKAEAIAHHTNRAKQTRLRDATWYLNRGLRPPRNG